MLDESNFEEPPNKFDMVFHNSVIGNGNKEKINSKLESKLEEKK